MYGQTACTVECPYLIMLLFPYWISGIYEMLLYMLQHFCCAVEITGCGPICIFTRERNTKMRLKLILCSKQLFFKIPFMVHESTFFFCLNSLFKRFGFGLWRHSPGLAATWTTSSKCTVASQSGSLHAAPSQEYN